MSDIETENLWLRVTGSDALQLAWHKVWSNGGSHGGDGVGLNAFKRDLFANLTQLRAELLNGTYRTGPFRRLSVPKKKPGYRILTVPSIRDRVLHTSIASALTPIFEPLFEDGSFAYRPGRGVTQAVERIETWRRRGYTTVIEADIVSYFDNIDHQILREKIKAVLDPLEGSAPLLALIDQVLSEQGRALGTPEAGLAQGSPLSPLLANLHLDLLDEEIESQGVKIVRFADDFVILCKTEKKARKVLQHCVEVLSAHNLRLHEDGTRIVSFDQGFDFIGYLFLRTLALKEKTDPKKKTRPVKSEVTEEGIIELDDNGSRFDPGKRVLYVLDPSHRLTVRNRSFAVERDDGSELIAVPYRRVGRLEVGPGVDFTRAPIDLALEAKADFALVDALGQTKGVAASSRVKSAALQMAQARSILDADFRLTIARSLVNARIRNQRTQLMRLNRTRQKDTAAEALVSMKRTLRKIDLAETVDTLLGAEGASAAAYWPALGQMLDSETSRVFRRERPARDAVNACMNYMTGILERDIRAAIQSTGLHPGFGFLHASKDRHHGLVYDFMEPFRAALTEGLVIYLFNARRLKHVPDDGQQEDEYVLKSEMRKALIGGYETAAAKRVNRPDGKGKLAWRAMMRQQAQSLVTALRSNDPGSFTPYLMEV